MFCRLWLHSSKESKYILQRYLIYCFIERKNGDKFLFNILFPAPQTFPQTKAINLYTNRGVLCRICSLLKSATTNDKTFDYTTLSRIDKYIYKTLLQT